jgi:hypothetical protein
MMQREKRVERDSRQGWVFLATAVLLLAAVFRLIWLSEVPPGLAQDEVLDADIATFIRQGEHALFFRHGYGHEPLYHYYAAPFQAVLGDNILSIRLPAAFLGLLLVALTLRWARRDFGPVVAISAGLGLAISWWPVIFSRIGIRPILEPMLLVVAVLFWVRRPWLAGLFLGLTLYSYTAARSLLLLPLLFAAYLWWLGRRPSSAGYRSHLRASVIVFGMALLLALPLAYLLWANPDLQQRVEQLEGPLTALRQGDPVPVLQMSFATLGVFSFTGDPRWTYTIPGRPLFEPLTAVIIYVGFALALWHWRRPRYAFLLIWLIVTLIPSAVTPDAPSTVRLVGAMPVIYLLPGMAVAAIFERLRVLQYSKREPAVFWRWGLGISLSAILLVNVWRTVADGFIRWPAELETRFRYQTVLRDMARYWERQAADEPTTPIVIAEPFFEPIDADSFRRNAGQLTAARWVQTGAGHAGAVVWPEGSPIAQIYVPEYAPLNATLQELAGIPPQPIYRSPTSPSFAVYQLPPLPTVTLETSEARFGEKVTLLGYAILPVENEQLPIVTYWQVNAILDADLTLFAHILNGLGQLSAQHDGLDAAAATLLPGDRFLQLHLLPLADGKERDRSEYAVLLGAYTRGDGRRLLVTNCDSISQTCASPAADALFLEREK